MGKSVKNTPEKIIQTLASKHKSLREFGKKIGEPATDIILWKRGVRKVRARAVIEICKHFPDISPHQLNPEVFPKNLTLTFKKDDK